jgi:hypothetical protein|tara:strand:+ start:110 stop:481 length:372 start_codon:yes stop_codon:yes gene_type:complete
MDVLVGLGLLIWSCGLFVFKQFFSDGLTSQSIVQIAVAGIGSLVILGPKAFSFLMNFELPDKDDNDLDEIELDDQDDYNDFKALNYLKDRSVQIGSQEAFDLVVKLNTLIFSGDYKEEEFYEE